MKLIAFDLETTGIRPESDRIMEFCFVQLDHGLAELGRWTELVDPGVAIPPKVQELTGITPAMVAGKQPFAFHAARIQRLVEGDTILVAHNHEFDLPFLNYELRRAGQPGLPADHRCIDTLVIERQFVNNRLESVYRRYTGKGMEGAHRSEADALATIEVLRRQRQAHADRLPEALEALVAPRIEALFEGGERARTWLDHDHRFYRDADGDIRFGFGKHRNEKAIDHEDYLLWMKAKDFSPETKATIDMVLKARPAKPAAPPAPAMHPAPATPPLAAPAAVPAPAPAAPPAAPPSPLPPPLPPAPA